MPAQDQTGPRGMGPQTGRGLGNCRGLRMGFRMNRGLGRGMGLGMGQGMGRGRFFNWPAQSPVDEEQELNEYEEALKQELEAVQKAKKTSSK